MNDKIKNILKKLNTGKHTAYIVGGFVRDYLLGIESFDVDIATSMEPREVREVFELTSDNSDNYGSIFIKDKLYNYDITTYRKEIKYENRRPIEYKYVNSIEEDIIRRDFTINSLYMDIDGNIHDCVGGREDLENKVIRMVGNIEEKIKEDPLRMLRSVRFAATLGFEIEEKLKNFLRLNASLLRTLSYTRKKEELDKIFASPNSLNGLNILKSLKFEEELEIVIPESLEATVNPLGIWSQLTIKGAYNFTKQESDTIEKINKIVNYGIIDNIVLYEYGLYPSIIAADIIKVNRGYISEMYKNLPIYSTKDICLSGEEIAKLLNITPSNILKEIIRDIELNILNNNLKNTKENLEEYIKNNWKAR